MKNSKKTFKGIFAAVLLIGTSIYAQEDDRGYIVKIGQPAPDFTVTKTDGTKFTLSENRGKVVMIQFTASWCGVCRKEMPHIEDEIWQPLKEKSFVLIGLDRDEPLDLVTKFAKKMKITYPLALDPDAEVFSLYALKEAGVTRNVIIDPQGKIVFLTRLYDEKEFNAMKDFIHDLIKQN
jgi:peroxiredoxin